MEKPNLGIIEYQGQDTNMIFTGQNTHNFSPFIDKNANCNHDEDIKLLQAITSGLMGYKSSDCLHWGPIKEDALFKKGAFDSHNLAFDTNYNKYVCYSRYFASTQETFNLSTGVRKAIQYNYSEDFLNWSDQSLIHMMKEYLLNISIPMPLCNALERSIYIYPFP